MISIHAPLTGCDATVKVIPGVVLEFQPTHPSRGATHNVLTHHSTYLFQSHTPLTGCDPFPLETPPPRRRISIHTPLTGCDYRRYNVSANDKHFNPHTPYGVRPWLFSHAGRGCEVQPTHPSRGATRCCNDYHRETKYFNPRTPHGVRQSLSTVDTPSFLFQSTHPSRGATGQELRVRNLW